MERILEAFAASIERYAKLKAYPLRRVKGFIAANLAELSCEHLDPLIDGGNPDDSLEDIVAFQRAQIAMFEFVCSNQNDVLIDTFWQSAIDWVDSQSEALENPEQAAANRAAEAIAEHVAFGEPLPPLPRREV